MINKILVTGGKGQLGSEVVEELKLKYSVISPCSTELDITDKTAVLTFFRKEKPDLIINCAAYTNVQKAEIEEGKAFSVNETGVENLALASKEMGTKFIHISTDFVFRGFRRLPYLESDLANPLNAYGRSKLAGEIVLKKILKNYIIIRTSWLYGLTGNNFVKTMLKKSQEKEKLLIVSDEFGTPTYSLDLAKAINIITSKISTEQEESNIWGIYHYSNKGEISWYDFAEAIIGEVNITPILVEECENSIKRPKYSVLDTSKIERVFGLNIPNWEESLEIFLSKIYNL